PRCIERLHDLCPQLLGSSERRSEATGLYPRPPRSLIALQMLRSRVADNVQPNVGQGSVLRDDAPINARSDDSIDRAIRDEAVTERCCEVSHLTALSPASARCAPWPCSLRLQ